MGLVHSLKNPGGLAACPLPRRPGWCLSKRGPCPVPYPHQLPELPSMAYSMSWGWLGVVVGTAVWLQQVPLAALSSSRHHICAEPHPGSPLWSWGYCLPWDTNPPSKSQQTHRQTLSLLSLANSHRLPRDLASNLRSWGHRTSLPWAWGRTSSLLSSPFSPGPYPQGPA